MNFLKLIAVTLLAFIVLVLIVTFMWLAVLIAAKIIEFVEDSLWLLERLINEINGNERVKRLKVE